MSKAKTPAIDPQSEAIILDYVGPGTTGELPARDLHGGDLARAAYVRRLQAATDADAPRPDPADAHGDIDALADELVATGIYARSATAAESTIPPAEPATEAEAQR